MKPHSENLSSLFFAVKKINSTQKVHAALRHVKREIQAELNSFGNIDANRSSMNYCLEGCANSRDGIRKIRNAINIYKHNRSRTVRSDAVIAIEVVFSLPASTKGIDLHSYFRDCLNWCKKEFHQTTLISADVHLDESNPHMHANSTHTPRPVTRLSKKKCVLGRYA